MRKSVDGRCKPPRLSKDSGSGREILEAIPDISGPFDDLYHLNRRAGAASIGSGLVTLTTRAVSSGTSCRVADVASDESEGDPEGWVRPALLKIVGPRARASDSCICSASPLSFAFSSDISSFFAASAVDSSRYCSRVSRSSAISRWRASRCAVSGSSSSRYCSLIVSRRFVRDWLIASAASSLTPSELSCQLRTR